MDYKHSYILLNGQQVHSGSSYTFGYLCSYCTTQLYIPFKHFDGVGGVPSNCCIYCYSDYCGWHFYPIGDGLTQSATCPCYCGR